MLIFDQTTGMWRNTRSLSEVVKALGEIKRAESRADIGAPIGSGTPLHAKREYEARLEENEKKKSDHSSPSPIPTPQEPSERQNHIEKGGNFYRGSPVPEPTAEEKAALEYKKKIVAQEKALKAQQEAVKSAQHNASLVIALVQNAMQDSCLTDYLERNPSATNQLGALLQNTTGKNPGNDALAIIIELNCRLNDNSIYQALSNTSESSLDKRKQWRSFFQPILDQKVKPKTVQIPRKRRQLSAKRSGSSNIVVNTCSFAINATLAAGLSMIALSADTHQDPPTTKAIDSFSCVSAINGVNIRETPQIAPDNIHTTLSFNTVVKHDGPVFNLTWQRVDVNGHHGYVHTDHIKPATNGLCPS